MYWEILSIKAKLLSPAISMVAHRLTLIEIAAKKDFLFGFDIENAFLNAPIEDETYIILPDVWKDKVGGGGREEACEGSLRSPPGAARMAAAIFGLSGLERLGGLQVRARHVQESFSYPQG